MSWRPGDPDEDPGRLGRPGGDWQGVRPSLDNPMTWSLFLARAAGIAVRVHVVFLVYVIIQLVRSLVPAHVGEPAPLGFGPTLLRLGCLFGIVLLHEFGHCLACRRTGGEADEILMWPLGGLAFCRPDPTWRAHLATALGGPMVNVVIFVVLAPTLGVLTGHWWGVAIPNPFGPLLPGDLGVREPWWLLTLFTIHDVSFMLLLFNLLPIFPLDGGRICQACLWSRFGYGRSMRLAVYAGYFGAIALGITGAVLRNWMLVAIAVFGGVTCYMTLKQLEWTDTFVGKGDDLYAASRWTTGEAEAGAGADVEETEDASTPGGGRRSRRAVRRAEREREAAEADAREVDRILAKIAGEGIESLTAAEKERLQQETVRRKREG